MSVLLTATKKSVQKPKSAKPKAKPKRSYTMNPGGPIGGPLPDVPPFSSDKTAVFFFEDFVEGYEVILMITRKEPKNPCDAKSGAKFPPGVKHNPEKLDVWSSVGCVTFEDHHFQPIDCPGFQEVGNGESILKFKIFMPESDNDPIDCMITRRLNKRNAKLKYRHILDWAGRTYVEHTEDNLTKGIPAPSNGAYGGGAAHRGSAPAAAFYSDPPPAYSVNDPYETKKKL